MAENPYVGPRPFERGEGAFFFGREREVQELLSLVVAHRVVLLYAASGAGKTSLLNAGLGPLLEHEEGFELLPPARVRALSASDPPKDANAYAFGVLTHLMPEAELAGQQHEPLAGFLSRREHPVGADGFAAPRALIVDQLEEVFTLYQERWSEREELFRQLAEALEADPLLRIVLAIREDYVAHLDPFSRLLPTALRTRMRLERLGRDSALRAATEPARRSGRPFAPGVAEKLVGDLLEMRVDTGGGQTQAVPGEYVEPVQLQVACRSLWSRLPVDATEITEEHRLVFGDVDQVLSQFYEETLAAAAARANLSGDELRERFAAAFITPLETRGTVYWTPTTTAGMAAEAIEEMDRRHLIRAEVRAGARWYELTHDRLIGPVRASNRARRTALAKTRRRRAGIGIAALVALLAAALAIAIATRKNDPPPGAAGGSDLIEAQITQQARGISSLTLVLHARGGPVVHASFAPDELRVLTLTEKGSVEIWTTNDGQRAASFVSSNADIATFPPVGYHLNGAAPVLVANIGGTAFMATQRGKIVATLPRGYSTLATPKFTNRGPGVVAVDRAGQPAYWNGKSLVRLGDQSGGVFMADVSRDGRRIVTSTGAHLDVWTPGGRHLSRLQAPAAFPPLLDDDGSRVAVADPAGGVTVWDTRTHRRLTPELTQTGRPVRALAFSGTGNLLAASDGTATARALVVDRRNVLELKAAAPVTDVAVSRDRRFVMTAHNDGTAQLWGIGGEKRADLSGQSGRIRTADFSAKTRLIATGAGDGTARVWGAAADLRIVALHRVGSAIKVKVENSGNRSSEASSVGLYGVRELASRPVGALRVGENQAVEFVASPLATRAVVDPDKKVRELSDNNNVWVIRSDETSGGSASKPPSRLTLRELIVRGAKAGLAQHEKIHYTLGPERMSGVRQKIRWPKVPPFEDASSFVTWCYWQAGARDPSELNYNGFEWSGALIAQGDVVTTPKPGDIAFYGTNSKKLDYVGIYIGDDAVIAHRRAHGPQKQPARKPGFLEFRSYLK